MQWMAWTAPTAVFFAVIALAIAGLTVWAALSPPVPRRGLLPMVTTRGDRFFVKIFLPTIAAGIGVAAFFCFMFSWVELLLARTLTATAAKPITSIMTRTVSASGMDWGLLAAAGTLTLIPGAVVIYFVRNYIAKGFALGRV